MLRLLVLALLLSGCRYRWEPDIEPDPEVRTLTYSGVAVVCAGGGRATGGGFVVESCTSPVEVTSGRGSGGGFVWVPGPVELVAR